MHELPPFPGFRQEAFTFLRELAAHNERDWFKPRKEIYEDELRWPMECLVSDIARQAHHERLPITGDPRGSIFRIYRDTRFSKNKQPYKTHVGAYLTRSGDRKENGGMYIHLQPDNCFLGAGFWQPERLLLRSWRIRMTNQPETFLDVAERLAAAGLTFETDDALKRLPVGFEHAAETPVAPYLRWKSFLVTRRVTDADLMQPAFTQTVLQTTRDALPLLEYGWQIMDALQPQQL